MTGSRMLIAAALLCAISGAALAQADGEPSADRGLRRLPSQPPPAAEPAPEAKPVCERAYPEADLTFADSKDFDRAFAKALGEDPDRLVLDVPAFLPGEAPKRLVPWLAEIQSAGGKIEQRTISCSRSFGRLGRLLAELFARATGQAHAAIRPYDAVLWVEKMSGEVRQVELTRRPKPAPQ